MKSTNINMQPTLSKTLGGHKRKKRWSKDGPFFFFPTKCKCRATYDLNVETISFASACGWCNQLI